MQAGISTFSFKPFHSAHHGVPKMITNTLTSFPLTELDEHFVRSPFVGKDHIPKHPQICTIRVGTVRYQDFNWVNERC